MRYVIIESPYAGEVTLNIQYAERCMLDAIDRGECPLAGHLLYTRVLKDEDPKERKRGIELHLALIELVFEAHGRDAPGDLDDNRATLAVYTDRGITAGMMQGIIKANDLGMKIEQRKLDP